MDWTFEPRRRLSLLLVVVAVLLLPRAVLAAPHEYDLVVSGEGRVGLFAALKLKNLVPRAKVAVFEKQQRESTLRPSARMYTQETLNELKKLDVSLFDFTAIRERLLVHEDGTAQKLGGPTRKEAAHHPYDLHGLLDSRAVATDTSGALERELRAKAQKLGVEIHYGAEVLKADSVSGGVELTVAGKDGPRVVRAHFGLLADGAHGVGARIAGTTVLGTVPLLTMESGEQGFGSFKVQRVPDPSARQGFVALMSIATDSGTSILAEVPPALQDRTLEERSGWFFEQARRAGFDAQLFPKDAAGRVALPKAHLASLSRGHTGRDHLFVVGDAAGALPLVMGSGINKGILQAVDAVSVMSDLLKHPEPLTREEARLFAHHTRANMAQDSLIYGLQRDMGSRLRPPRKAAPGPEPVASAPPPPAARPLVARLPPVRPVAPRVRTVAPIAPMRRR